MSRSIIIGDVHGCAVELYRLIETIAPINTDYFYFLGDLVNRGPDSHEVIRLVRELPNVRSLMGNHELRLLSFSKTKDASTLKPYDMHTLNQLTPDDMEFLEKMEKPFFSDTAQCILVHAGFLPNIAWHEQGLEISTEIQVVSKKGNARRKTACPDGTPWYDFWDGKLSVVYGHWPRPEITEKNNTIGIDTGCLYGGKLSALILPEKRFVQIPALKNYTLT